MKFFSHFQNKQSVVVTSTLATIELHTLLESTGKKAVVMGTSGPKDQVSSSDLLPFWRL